MIRWFYQDKILNGLRQLEPGQDLEWEKAVIESQVRKRVTERVTTVFVEQPLAFPVLLTSRGATLVTEPPHPNIAPLKNPPIYTLHHHSVYNQ